MSPGSIIMLIVSILTVWGGMILSIFLLRRFPDEPERPETGPIEWGPPRW